MWSKEILYIAHKNQAHIQLLLLYRIQSYIGLYFMHIRNLKYFPIGIMSKYFCELFHQVISPHFIMIKL